MTMFGFIAVTLFVISAIAFYDVIHNVIHGESFVDILGCCFSTGLCTVMLWVSVAIAKSKMGVDFHTDIDAMLRFGAAMLFVSCLVLILFVSFGFRTEE